MSTIATTINTNDNNTEPRGSSHPEAHQKSKLTIDQVQRVQQILQDRRAILYTTAALSRAVNSGALNDWEKNFLNDMIGKFRRYGMKTRLTLAQVTTINRLTLKAAH